MSGHGPFTGERVPEQWPVATVPAGLNAVSVTVQVTHPKRGELFFWRLDPAGKNRALTEITEWNWQEQ
jgi:hypothetical protein